MSYKNNNTPLAGLYPLQDSFSKAFGLGHFKLSDYGFQGGGGDLFISQFKYNNQTLSTNTSGYEYQNTPLPFCNSRYFPQPQIINSASQSYIGFSTDWAGPNNYYFENPGCYHIYRQKNASNEWHTYIDRIDGALTNSPSQHIEGHNSVAIILGLQARGGSGGKGRYDSSGTNEVASGGGGGSGGFALLYVNLHHGSVWVDLHPAVIKVYANTVAEANQLLWVSPGEDGGAGSIDNEKGGSGGEGGKVTFYQESVPSNTHRGENFKSHSWIYCINWLVGVSGGNGAYSYNWGSNKRHNGTPGGFHSEVTCCYINDEGKTLPIVHRNTNSSSWEAPSYAYGETTDQSTAPVFAGGGGGGASIFGRGGSFTSRPGPGGGGCGSSAWESDESDDKKAYMNYGTECMWIHLA